MKPRTFVLILLTSLGLLTALGLQGCLFGGGKRAAESAGGPEAAGPPAGEMPPGEMPGEMPPGGEMAGAAPPAEGMPGEVPPGEEMPGEMGATPAPAAGGDASALVEEGMRAKHAGNYAEARAKFEAAVAADASNLQAHWGLAWVYAELADAGAADLKDKAIAEFNTVLELGASGEMAEEAQAALKRLK